MAGGAVEVLRHVTALRGSSTGASLNVAAWRGPRAARPDLLVVLDGSSAMRALPGVADLLRDGPRAGVAFICIDRDITSLPAETRVSLDIAHTGEEAILREDGRTLSGIVPDLPSPGWLEGVSRAMAPFVDATPESGHGGAAAGRVVRRAAPRSGRRPGHGRRARASRGRAAPGARSRCSDGRPTGTSWSTWRGRAARARRRHHGLRQVRAAPGPRDRPRRDATGRTSSASSSSTTRAARPSATAPGCRTRSASSPTSTPT